MALPTTTEIQSYLSQRCGVTITGGDSSVAQMLAASIADLEKTSGYRPFVAGSASAKSLLSPYTWPAAVRLPNGIVELTSVVENGVALVAGTDYDLCGSGITGPSQSIQVYTARSKPGKFALVVTAKWGYCLDADLPADLKDAIIMHAAGSILEALRAGNITESGERWTDGDVSVSYGSGGGGMAGGEGATGGAGMITAAKAVFAKYQRVAVF